MNDFCILCNLYNFAQFAQCTQFAMMFVNHFMVCKYSDASIPKSKYWVLMCSTSTIGARSHRQSSVVGRWSSVVGRRWSVVGRRSSVVGRRSSVVCGRGWFVIVVVVVVVVGGGCCDVVVVASVASFIRVRAPSRANYARNIAVAEMPK